MRDRYAEQPNIVMINHWRFVRHRGHTHLEGVVVGHPKVADFSSWSSARIVGMRGRLVVTATGTHYRLGLNQKKEIR